MGKHLKLFNLNNEYTSFLEGDEFVTPNVSYVIENDIVYYNPHTEAKETGLVCTYNVTDTTSATPVCYETSGFTLMEVDGVLLDGVTTEYTFNTVGEHTIKFKLANPTSIGNDAFYGCTGLTSITIPDSVTSIGRYAFSSCTGLTSVNIPDSVTTIGEYAFSSCTGLTSVNIPDSVTTIEDNAFKGCTGLTSITIPDSVTTIEDNAFKGCTSLPVENNLRYADTYLVEATDKTLTTYNIKEGTKFIGTNAFSSCTSLTSITIPDSVTSIGGNAFKGCTGLTSVNIPDSVTTIGDEAFYRCTSLPVVDNIYYAETYLVGVVDESLSTYTIKEGTKWIGTYAFSSCTGLTSITIPDSVTSIGGFAFSDCTGLTSITIPDSVTSIGEYAFSDTGLTSITIPNSVTTIGYNAFYNSSNLTSVVIPDSVTSINGGAFFNCSKLKSITCNAITAPSIKFNTFRNVKKYGILKVPVGSDYSTWMSTDEYYLGYYSWTIQEI